MAICRVEQVQDDINAYGLGIKEGERESQVATTVNGGASGVTVTRATKNV